MSSTATTITALGHASFKVVTPDGKVILVDPWINGNPVFPEALKDDLKANLILITHGHGDHMDVEWLKASAMDTNIRIAAQAQVRTYLTTLGFKNFEGINTGGTIDVQGLKISMTLAYHSSQINLPDGTTGYTHEAIGYVLTTSDTSIYFAGDTALFGDMQLIKEIYHPKIAVLPIGDRVTMGPREAAYATKLLGVSHVIPMHYGTFPFLTGTAEMLVDAVKDQPNVKIHALKAGETLNTADCE
ncbi:MAG TPA: metal-dependent hydrolase [Phototrophicaceae bacterium]|nr:metal-dependent hydrolase [Phototrophicaceae bacterium]